MPKIGFKHSKETKEKLRKANLGKKLSKEHRENISKGITGENNPFWNRKHSELTKEKIRLAVKKQFRDLGHPFKGKHHSIESNIKNRQAHLGKRASEETKTKMRLKVLSEETKRKIGQKNKGRRMSEYNKKRLLEVHLGRKHTGEELRKMRLSTINRIERNYGIPIPSYNKSACEFFKNFDEIHNTKGHYAMYGGGEWYISELGYWPDYINFELKLIIEWDEDFHYNPDGTLRERDARRQEEIKKLYPGFKFLRINSVTNRVIKV